MPEKIPRAWVDAVKRAILPELTELRHSVDMLGVKVESLTTRVDSFRSEMLARIESVDKRLPLIEDLASVKVRLAEIEKKVGSQSR